MPRRPVCAPGTSSRSCRSRRNSRRCRRRGTGSDRILGLAADGERREQHSLGVVGALLVRRRAPRRSRPAAPCAGSRRRRSRCGPGRRSRPRHLVAQRGLVDALIEPHALLSSSSSSRLRRPACSCLHVDRDIFAGVGERHDRLDGVVADDDHAHGCWRAPPSGANRMRSFWPSRSRCVAAARRRAPRRSARSRPATRRGPRIERDVSFFFTATSARSAVAGRRSGLPSSAAW